MKMENVIEERAKAVDEKFCTDCGEKIKLKAEICPNCGVRQMAAPAPAMQNVAASGKSRITTALLAFFLGGIGVHRFYLGNIFLGFLYLIFCWTFIPAIIAFIEFIVFLVMSDDEFNKKYGAS